jgi:uroporphyrinogen-III synthase
MNDLAQQGVQTLALSFQATQSSAIQREQVRQLWQQLAQFDDIVFVSPSAVDHFFESKLTQNNAQLPAWPERLRALAIGPGSWQSVADALNKMGLNCINPVLEQTLDAQNKDFDANNLAQWLIQDLPSQAQQGSGTKLLIVRGERGREDWIEQLNQSGFQTQILSAYSIIELVPDAVSIENQLNQLTDTVKAQPLVIVVASVNQALRLIQWIEQANDITPKLAHQLRRAQYWAIHSKIVAALRPLGGNAVQLIKPGAKGIVDAYQHWK